ncbi:hypothetical protein ACAW74_08335 [Fibrella sp. WM1]|uniref:hypothetical protein n=1 Tax=Fibrella musci TaxID=3242485 RepID=UPI003520FDAF
MKSITAFFLGLLILAGSLFPQTDVEEVYKIPGLLAHYQVHKQAAGRDFDFWQFLDMHYNPSSEHAKTPHKGVKIPLFNHLSLGLIFTVPQPQRFCVDLLVERLIYQPHFSYQNLYCFRAAALLFQPPQLG